MPSRRRWRDTSDRDVNRFLAVLIPAEVVWAAIYPFVLNENATAQANRIALLIFGALAAVAAGYFALQNIADRWIPLLASSDGGEDRSFPVGGVIIMIVVGSFVVIWTLHEPPQTFDDGRLMPLGLAIPLLILGPCLGLRSMGREIAHRLEIRRLERAKQRRTALRRTRRESNSQ